MEAKIKEKRWNHSIEKTIWNEWQRKKIFKFNVNSGRPLFVIDTPPPYPSSV